MIKYTLRDKLKVFIYSRTPAYRLQGFLYRKLSHRDFKKDIFWKFYRYKSIRKTINRIDYLDGWLRREIKHLLRRLVSSDMGRMVMALSLHPYSDY